MSKCFNVRINEVGIKWGTGKSVLFVATFVLCKILL